ncbi:hypothetical protein LQW54_001398 [Pestalotiopsis sp. IQ-011]
MPHPSSYASSTYSTSTTYTIDDMKASYPSTSSSPKSKRSLGKKFKSVLSSLGEDPTARHDRKHGLEAREPFYTPALPVSRI